MDSKNGFERIMFWVFTIYVMSLPASMLLLTVGDWLPLTLSSGMVMLLSVVDALIEGQEARRR